MSVLNGNFGSLGYVVIAIFVVTWVISIFVYQINRYDTIEARRSGLLISATSPLSRNLTLSNLF
jgi:hypothetical protein